MKLLTGLCQDDVNLGHVKEQITPLCARGHF